MLLAEWRDWWTRSGERELRGLLIENWDVMRDDPEAARSFEEHLLPLARRLHEGATRIAVQAFLSDLRRMWQPNRYGRRWTTKDRRVAQKIVDWYQGATGE